MGLTSNEITGVRHMKTRDTKLTMKGKRPIQHGVSKSKLNEPLGTDYVTTMEKRPPSNRIG